MKKDGIYLNMPSDAFFFPLNGEVVVGDTETTGLYPFGTVDGVQVHDTEGCSRLCSAAFVRMQRTLTGWQKTSEFSFLVDPERGIPEKAARVNGFSRQNGLGIEGRLNLFGFPRFTDIADTFLNFIGNTPLCFHNSVFDSAVLDAELLRCGLPMLGNTLFCTKMAFSEILGHGRPYSYVSGTNLNALCGTLGISNNARIGLDGVEMHGASVDRDLAALCMVKLEAMGLMKPEAPQSMPHRNVDLYSQYRKLS